METLETGIHDETGMHAGMAMLLNHCVKTMAVQHIANECFLGPLGFLRSVEARECVQAIEDMRLMQDAE